MNTLTERAKATILLCSRVGIPDGVAGNIKPYTSIGWYNLGVRIRDSVIKWPENLFGMTVDEIKKYLYLTYMYIRVYYFD